MAYVLGFIVADGALTLTGRGTHFVEITSTDKGILYSIRKALDSDLRIGAYQNKKNQWKKRYRLQVGSKEMFRDLEKLGLSPRKSMVIRMCPVPEEHLASFVRGYFDGDGCVTFGEYPRAGRKTLQVILATRFTSGSKDMLVGLKLRLSAAIGIAGSITYYSNAWRLCYGGSDSKKLYKFMYFMGNRDSKGLICLRRKRRIYERAALQR